MIIRKVISLLLLSFGYFQGLAQEDCSLRKDDQGVKVYLCNNPASKFKTIIVEFDIQATISQYAALSLNIDRYKEWQYKNSDHKILKQDSELELTYYALVHTPWPTSNRDYIFHFKMEQDSTATLRVWLSAKPDLLPENEGVVRIPYAESLLTVTPTEAEQAHVRYVLNINPGGEVPAWVVNMFAANAPWETYVNFINLIKAQGQHRLEVPFIRNYDQ